MLLINSYMKFFKLLSFVENIEQYTLYYSKMFFSMISLKTKKIETCDSVTNVIGIIFKFFVFV